MAKATEVKTQKLKLRNLIPGMVVAEDIYDIQDQLIVPMHSVLTDGIIERLEYYEVSWISVVENEEFHQLIEEHSQPDIPVSYLDRVRQSPEFKKFKNNYTENVATLKKSIHAILDSEDVVDTSDLLDTTVNLLAQSRTTLHVFDMLQSMRDSDDSTFSHCVNVSLLACVLGKWLGFPQDKIERLSLAGLLHDIGKLAIPEMILNKSTHLTANEYDLLKTHTTQGYDILKSKQVGDDVAEVALTHHERCDGSGYPNGATADEISEFSKIIAIVDVYDAMTAARSYRDPICPFEVINRFESEGYQKYDPQIIMTFLENVVSSYQGNQVILNTGQTGEVVMINKLDLSRPIIQLSDGNFLDLSKERSTKILAII